ncbi:hypothetical protein ACMFMG_002117 [Clarireedia jacksonii]
MQLRNSIEYSTKRELTGASGMKAPSLSSCELGAQSKTSRLLVLRNFNEVFLKTCYNFSSNKCLVTLTFIKRELRAVIPGTVLKVIQSCITYMFCFSLWYFNILIEVLKYAIDTMVLYMWIQPQYHRLNA